MHFTSAIHNTAFTIVLGYVELCAGTGDSNFQKKQYIDLCKVCDRIKHVNGIQIEISHQRLTEPRKERILSFAECVTGSIYSMFGGLVQSTLGEYEKLSQNHGVACQT